MPSWCPEVGRPADPGQGVDQGAALEAEGPADRRFAGARCIGSERPAKEP
jgi:hypothetical protein